MNWYPRYYGDYMRDTGHLTLAEHGAYTVLLDHYYASGQPLVADDNTAIRICRAFTQEEQTAVRSVLDKFFPVNGDGMRHNKRADKEIAKESAISASRSTAATNRWGKRNKSIVKAQQVHMQLHSTCNANDTTSTSTSTVLPPDPPPQPPVVSPTSILSASGKPKRIPKLATDEDWIAKAKQSYGAMGIDVDTEMRKAQAWLATNPKAKGRTFTQSFMARWLAKADKQIPMSHVSQERTQADLDAEFEAVKREMAERKR